MGEQINLSAELRTEQDGKPNKLRAAGFIPAVIYGAGKENILVKFKQNEFAKAFEKAGEATLLEIDIEGAKKEKVLIYYAQTDPSTRKLLSVDLLRVDMKKELTTEIPLVFIGESEAVEVKKANLVKAMSELEVTCLPEDLVSGIEVDLSILKEIGDMIKISQVKLPKGIKPTADPDDVIAVVREQAAEEPEAVPVSTEEAKEPDKADEKKDDKKKE